MRRGWRASRSHISHGFAWNMWNLNCWYLLVWFHLISIASPCFTSDLEGKRSDRRHLSKVPSSPQVGQPPQQCNVRYCTVERYKDGRSSWHRGNQRMQRGINLAASHRSRGRLPDNCNRNVTGNRSAWYPEKHQDTLCLKHLRHNPARLRVCRRVCKCKERLDLSDSEWFMWQPWPLHICTSAWSNLVSLILPTNAACCPDHHIEDVVLLNKIGEIA